MNLLIVDGHAATHSGLRRQVQTCFSGVNIQSTTDVSSALAFIENNYFDIIITDLNQRDCHGLHGLRRICYYAKQQRARVLLYTAMLYNPELMSDAETLGVDGYLSKTETLKRLRHTLRGILWGRQFPQIKTVTVLKPIIDENDEILINSLSSVEIAILSGLVGRLTLGEIATSRKRSLQTINTQLKSIRQKLGVSTTTAAVVIYVHVRLKQGRRFQISSTQQSADSQQRAARPQAPAHQLLAHQAA